MSERVYAYVYVRIRERERERGREAEEGEQAKERERKEDHEKEKKKQNHNPGETIKNLRTTRPNKGEVRHRVGWLGRGKEGKKNLENKAKKKNFLIQEVTDSESITNHLIH